MITTKKLIDGRNFIDGSDGEYIGTFFDDGSFYAAFDSKRPQTVDRFTLTDKFTLVLVPMNAYTDYPNEYSVEAFGVSEEGPRVVLMDLEN